jgi:hypothetical protein
MKLRRCVRGFLFLAALLPLPAQAQTSSLFVRVMGPTGPVAGAEVSVVFAESAFLLARTDDDGNARLSPLPAGTYSVQVRAFGYDPFREDGVRVDAGTRRNLEVALRVAPVELREIVVRADRIEIERETVEFATEITAEAMSLLPVSREARELVALTPGARPDHVWGGASAQANNYRIDGLSMNHPGMGSDLFQPSPFWIESIEIRGLGAGAEYGGFQGGLVDMATKRGNNRVEGSVRSTLEHDGLTGSNLVKTEIGTEVARRLDVEGEVRGPVIPDRLFYYLSGQYVSQDSKALNHLSQVADRYAPFSEERAESRAFGKLTWTPSDADLIEVSTAYTNTNADNYELSGYEEEGATYHYESPTWLLNGTFRKLLGSQVMLEGRVNRIQADERSDPFQGRAVPGITNYTPNPPHNAFGNAPFFLRSAPTSTSASAVGTFRVRTGEVEHSLKVGGEYTRGAFRNKRSRNGGMTWIPAQYDDFDPSDPLAWRGIDGDGIPTMWGGEVKLDADVVNAALFVQSALSLGNRVVFSPGIRWGQWKGWITPSSGERFLAVQDDAWDPRIGISVDLTGGGTLVAKAHWGRYHQSLITQMFDRVSGADVFTNEEFWDYTGSPITDPGIPFTQTERDSLAASGLFRKVGEAVLNETGRVEDYRQPYVEQWLVGLEKKIGSSAKFEVLYSRRSNRDMVALVDLNRETNYTFFSRARPLTNDGYYVLYNLNGVVFKEFYLPNHVVIERLRCLGDGSCPGAMPIPGLTPADTLGMSWNPEYVLTTAPDGKREFSQLQLTLDLARPAWGGSLSFVLTDLKGNLDNVSGYTDPLGFGPGPYVRVNEAVNSYGSLENFSEWEMKAFLWGTLPGGLRGGLFWTWRAGDHYLLRYRLSGMGVNRYWVGPKGTVPGHTKVLGEIDYRLVKPLEGHNVIIGPRGQLELERQSITDLRLEKTFRIGGRRLAATLDIFNLFRCEAIAEKNNMINHAPYHWRGDKVEWGDIPPNQRFGVALDRVRPQTIRLGLMAYF